MAAAILAPVAANDDGRPAREVYLPPLPDMGPIERQFLTQFWGARFPVLVAPPAPETDW